MRNWAWLAIGLALATTGAQGADYSTLRHLSASAPTQVTPLPAGSTVRPVQFARVAIEPRDGEDWAIAYTSILLRAQNDHTPAHRFLTWSSGRVEAQTTSFQRVFDEELKKAGFIADGGESLFGEGTSGADLKVGVLIDDIQGRFCVDCPNLFNRGGAPATVVMTAKWEIYSTLDRKVVAKITTTGGADFKTRLQNSVAPAVYEGFRENVRLLAANEDFRKLVTQPAVAQPIPATPPGAIELSLGRTHLAAREATNAVAVVFAADGSGSGFLVSTDGYLLTNQHVVGGSKYVKLKWTDGSETLGEVVRSDRRRDVALVKADAHGRAPLDLRLSPVQQGEPVFAIGSPLGEALQNTMTKGIVSATRIQDGQPFIQSDVAVTHGSSGGPLLDEKGQVVALTVSVIEPNGSPIGLNFFIPIGDALRALGLTAPPAAAPLQAAVAPPARAGRKH